MGKLTIKQQLFVEEYLIDLNATQAAIRAGYSIKTAEQQGSRMLAMTKISESLDKAMAERSKRTGISQDRVLQELARIAFVNITDLVDIDTAEILKSANADDLAVIQGVKVKNRISGKSSATEREVRFADKLRALEQLGRHLGMFNDKMNIEANVSGDKLADIMNQIGGEGLTE